MSFSLKLLALAGVASSTPMLAAVFLSPDMWETALKQAPALVIMCAIVYVFIRYIAGRDKQLIQRERENDVIQEKSLAIIDKNTERLGELKSTLNETTRVLRRTNEIMEITERKLRNGNFR